MSDYVFRNVRIHATDVDTSFAAQVTSGVFAEQEVSRTPRDFRQKYFRPASTPGSVQIVPELQTKVTFAQHDLRSLRPVREGLSMIVCKNVLLHFDESPRIQVLRMFRRALQPDGILVMENTQTLPALLAAGFQRLAPYAQVYRKADRTVVGHLAEGIVPRRLCPKGVDGPEERTSFPNSKITPRTIESGLGAD